MTTSRPGHEDEARRPLDAEDLRSLQETFLRGVLLPSPAFSLPDMPILTRLGTVYLLDENLAEGFSAREMPLPVQVVTRAEATEKARELGDLGVLRFGPSRGERPPVSLALEGALIPRDPHQHQLGLSGLRVRFERDADGWRAVEEPTSFAT